MQFHLRNLSILTGRSQQQQLEALSFESLVIRLYAFGEFLSGRPLKGCTRREFLDLLSQYNVSVR